MAQDLIMIVTNSVSGGGAERAMNLLANELHNKNIPVLLVALNKSGSDFVEIKSPLLDLGREKSDGLIRFVNTYFRYLASVHAKKPSLIVTNCYLPEFFTCLLPINACFRWKISKNSKKARCLTRHRKEATGAFIIYW